MLADRHAAVNQRVASPFFLLCLLIAVRRTVENMFPAVCPNRHDRLSLARPPPFTFLGYLFHTGFSRSGRIDFFECFGCRLPYSLSLMLQRLTQVGDCGLGGRAYCLQREASALGNLLIRVAQGVRQRPYDGVIDKADVTKC